MIQEIVVAVLFLLALVYVGRMVWMQFKTKDTGCAKGCSGCSTIDLNKIEADIKKKSFTNV